MTTTPRRASAAFLALGLLFGTVSCGSDSDGAADEVTTTAASSDGPTADTSSTGGDDEPAGDAPVDCAADEEAGQGNLSSSAAVLFTADTDSGGSDADITPETTLTVSADGTSIDPSTLTVDVGEVFGIVVAEGGNIDGASVGCATGQTILVGTPVGFVITEPGTYPIVLDIGGVEVGTVTAE